MAEPFIGEIRMFAGSYAPRDWAFCDGQIMSISQYNALFSLFGTMYGGDGRTSFGLPDMRGRLPLHFGNGQGLSHRIVGERGGSETVTLTPSELPSHSHSLNASTALADTSSPSGHVLADEDENLRIYDEQAQTSSLASDVIGYTGGSQPHSNLMPTLCVNFIVALFGIYPSRS